MLKHSEIPTVSSDVVKLAIELHAQDQAQTRQKESVVAALDEMQIPVEYLHRAAAEVDRQQAQRGKRQRKKLGAALVGVCVVPAIIFGLKAAYQNRMPEETAPPPTVTWKPPVTQAPPSAVKAGPLVYDFNTDPQNQWSLRNSTSSQVDLAFNKDGHGNKYATLTVGHFRPDQYGDYWSNMFTMDGTHDLSSYHVVKFRARGTGLRMEIWLSDNHIDDWTSTPLIISKEWQTYTLRLDQLPHVARSSNGAILNSLPKPIGQISWITFQTGIGINDVSAHGHIDIDDLKFE